MRIGGEWAHSAHPRRWRGACVRAAAARNLLAPPQEEHAEQRQVESGVDREGGRCPRRQHDHAAERRAEAARDIVADRAQRDRGRQMLGPDLLADRGLPGRPVERDPGADERAEGEQQPGAREPEPGERRERAAQRVAKPSPVIAILRRSNMSAIAPPGTETSISGSISADCTSATISAEVVSRVISQAAATPRMSWPKFDSRLVDQILRKVRSRSGSNGPQRAGGRQGCRRKSSFVRSRRLHEPHAGCARAGGECAVRGGWFARAPAPRPARPGVPVALRRRIRGLQRQPHPLAAGRAHSTPIQSRNNSATRSQHAEIQPQRLAASLCMVGCRHRNHGRRP